MGGACWVSSACIHRLGEGTRLHVGPQERVPQRDAEGWESVGDMGYLDADGYLYLGDRKTDMILRTEKTSRKKENIHWKMTAQVRWTRTTRLVPCLRNPRTWT